MNGTLQSPASPAPSCRYDRFAERHTRRRVLALGLSLALMLAFGLYRGLCSLVYRLTGHQLPRP